MGCLFRSKRLKVNKLGMSKMDVTKEYQNMCKAAQEIQEQWCQFEATVGDMCAETNQWQIESKPQVFVRRDSESNFIWLPRQDQLQDMITVPRTHENKSTIMHKVDALHAWMHAHKPYTYQFISGEQLWLAFVMLLNYNKVWNGKEWTIQVNPNQ